MHILLDHLGATLVAVSIFLILAVVQLRSGEAAVDQTRYYSAKAHLLETRMMIEGDFDNIGFGVSRHDTVFVAASDTTLTFMAKLASGDADPSEISYRRVADEVITVDGQEVQLYKIERLINGAVTGSTPSTLTEFAFELRDAAGDLTADLDEVREVSVRLVVLPPLDAKEQGGEARWNRTFRPANLSNF